VSWSLDGKIDKKSNLKVLLRIYKISRHFLFHGIKIVFICLISTTRLKKSSYILKDNPLIINDLIANNGGNYA